MSESNDREFASRAGAKLACALDAFALSPAGLVCADLGCSTGGFTDCLLQRGAARVFAVDRGYGVLALALRNDKRVVVMERTDALKVHLPERVGLVTIDAGWTRQELILPVAARLLAPEGRIVTLVKPQYEAAAAGLGECALQHGVLPDEQIESVLAALRPMVAALGLRILGEVASPIRGQGGNREVLWMLEPS